jgi:hypothetical protein
MGEHADIPGDLSAARSLEAEMWARFEEAAAKVGCPSEQIRPYYDMALDTCRPALMRPDGTLDLLRKPPGPAPALETLQAQYRMALFELRKCLDPKRLERTFSQVVKDAIAR